MTEAPTPKPTLKEQAAGWFKKGKEAGSQAAGYVGKGLEDVSVATGLNPLVQEVGGLANKGLNSAAEVAVDVGTTIDRGIDLIDQTVQSVGIHLGRAKEFYDKYNDPSALVARIKERGKALVDHVLGDVAEFAEREVGSRVETAYYDHAVGLLKLIGVGDVWGDVVADVKKLQEQQKRKKAEKSGEAPKEADPRLESVTAVIEGSDLLKLVSEGREAAIQFDSLPNATGITIAERLLQGSVPGVTEKATEVSDMKKKVIEARGQQPDISFDHEQRLIDRSESRQKEAAILGLEILDLLPETAEEITRAGFLEARTKAIDLARKNKGMINALSAIGESIMLRFPDKADAVKAELAKLTTPLYENNEVAQSIYEQVDTEGMARQASGELYVTLIKGNEIFGRLSKAQQDEATQSLGATRKEGINGRNKYDRYDAKEGSSYDVALKAYTELTRVGAAYEAMREHVAEHPELAGQLVIMAERVAQAKYALRLARNEFQAQMTIKAKELFDAENAKSLEVAHTAGEESDRKDRKDYYVRILDRQAARIAAEKPTVQRINKYLAVGAGVAVGAFAAVEAAPVVAELAPHVLEYLIKAYQFVTTNFDTTLKTIGAAGTLLGAAKLSEFLSGKLGPVVGKRAEGLREKTAQANASAVDKLNGLLATLEDNDPRRQQLEEIIGGLSKS